MKKHRKRAIAMAYKVIILYRLYMPPYFLGTFTEYPFLEYKDTSKVAYVHANALDRQPLVF